MTMITKTTNSNILEVEGLCKSYDNSFTLKNVSFAVPTGYIMGFIGPNGAGKTTTIKSIINSVRYSSGTIKLFGEDSLASTAQINEQIGVVMDAPFYSEDWTMNDVEAAVSPFYSQWDREKYAELLSTFGIEKKKKVKELSRGMKVKLMMAVALSHDARLLILDEPTSGLDPVARDELCDLLGAFMADESKSVLFSTHITADLEKIADYITFIFNGEIIFSGLKETLLEKYVLVKGGLQDLDDDLKQLLIGLRTYETGFEGMAELTHINKFPKEISFEPITLEEIIIFMSKGAKSNE